MRRKTLVKLGLTKRCGAKTRKGTPCQCLKVYKSGRCKFHGGLSTGPRTTEGKQRIREALRNYWAKRGAG